MRLHPARGRYLAGMETPGEFRVRSLALSVYVPNLLYAVGQGAVVPVIALLALDLGATPAIAGVIVALKGLGTALFDAPAGVLVARIGERNAMVAATVTLALAAGAIAAGPNLVVYGGLVIVLDLLIPPGSIPLYISAGRIITSIVLLLFAAVVGCAFSLRRVLRVDPASALGSSQ